MCVCISCVCVRVSGVCVCQLFVCVLTPGELVLRRHRSLHQLGLDQLGTQAVCVFGVVLRTHTHTHTDLVHQSLLETCRPPRWVDSTDGGSEVGFGWRCSRCELNVPLGRRRTELKRRGVRTD